MHFTVRAQGDPRAAAPLSWHGLHTSTTHAWVMPPTSRWPSQPAHTLKQQRPAADRTLGVKVVGDLASQAGHIVAALHRQHLQGGDGSGCRRPHVSNRAPTSTNHLKGHEKHFGHPAIVAATVEGGEQPAPTAQTITLCVTPSSVSSTKPSSMAPIHCLQ